MKTNLKRQPVYTHESGKAKHINAEQQLRRSVMSCLLWENSFYESGENIAERITRLANQCNVEVVCSIAIEARTKHNLRHVPLLLLLSAIRKGGSVVSDTIYQVISRPDEITELVSLYWLNGKKPLSSQMKKGLAKAFSKFDEYQFSKYNREAEIKLRDVMFLVHAKPKDKQAEYLYQKIANNTLSKPNTWESRMAGGEDKKQVFESLLSENKLGYMALLRNLRGMTDCGVDKKLIKSALLNGNSNRVLPFRFLSAAKHAPQFEPELDEAMQKSLSQSEPLKGHTVLLVDVSGSMSSMLSSRSELTRLDSACGLAILLSGICEDITICAFGTNMSILPPRQGMALADCLKSARLGHDTRLGNAVNVLNNNYDYDRLIVITDEQSSDKVPNPKGKGYVINVASYQNGVGYGAWVHIDGFSESCVEFLKEYEKK